mgnify:CR=1 FL=1
MKKVSTVLLSVVTVLALIPAVSWGASLFYVDDNGNVGIGNVSPQHKLDVSGAMYSRLVTATSSTINWNAGNVQSVSLTSNPTLTFNSGQAGGEYTLILNQDSTGGRAVTWPGTVKWSGGGSAPTLSSLSNSTDTVHFLYDGTNYLGTYALNFGLSPLLNQIVAYWKLDESSGTAADATGNGYTLSNNNSATYGAGKINNSVIFAASSSQNLYGNSTLGLTQGGDITADLWFKPASTPSGGNVYTLFTTGNGGTSPYVRYWIGYADVSGTLKLRFNRERTCISNNFTDYATTLSNGTWYHIVMTYDGTNIRGYLNGSLVAGPTAQSGNGNSSCPDTYYTSIGSMVSGGFINNTDGSIDEVGVWSRALTGSEITSLYNGGIGRQYPF